ncbi:MAG TPA: M14 family metallopeptidase [Gemmatimonadaceae bacterium]|nr:M14 family metallopeptidase [Gemmatimonadaceae bacterium]
MARSYARVLAPLVAAVLAAACGGGASPAAGPAPGGPPRPDRGERSRISPVNIHAVYPTNFASERPLTRAERTNFMETSHYADVIAFIDSLKLLEKDQIATGVIGKTSEGREIPYVVASRPLVHTAAEAQRLNRPIVYVQADIHAGEVEGKEAMLAMLRELTDDKDPNVLDSLVLVVVPIYNADGNEMFGPQETRRPAQDGPELVGQRANGQGLDLNRDYIKADAPETQASLRMFDAWDPDVFVDLHTTDGTYHGYALTYAASLSPAAKFTGPFTMDTLLPAVRRNLLARERIQTFDYGNVESPDGGPRGWYTYDARPRYGTNYYGLRGRISVLSEAYSHDPFRTRIASTYAFVGELLSLIAANKEEIVDVAHEADRKTIAGGTTPSDAPFVSLRAEYTQHPEYADIILEDLAKLPDSTEKLPGVKRGYRRIGKFHTERMPVYDRFQSTLDRRMPVAYAFGADQKPLVDRLRLHGIFVEQLVDSLNVAAERFAIDSLIRNPQEYQGHHEERLEGLWTPLAVTLPAGTYVVREAQPLAILAMYLLEPESDDGFTTWNVMDDWIGPGRDYPVLRIVEPFAVNAPLRPINP